MTPERSLDLHTHSHYSDGTLPPADVVKRAHAAGVRVMALTDHDSVAGWPEAKEAAREAGVTLFCGIEINTCEHDNLHILGYGVDPFSPALVKKLEEFRARRTIRLKRIVERLKGLGLDLDWEDVEAVSRQTLGRPHVADALRKKGLVSSRKEAFDRYLVKGRPGYVEPMGPTPEEAITAIREAGGWSSLAHPGVMETDEKLKRLVASGLGGVEVFYPTHSATTKDRLLAYAKQHGLTATAGSDFHGPRTGREGIGGAEMEGGLADALRRRLGDGRS